MSDAVKLTASKLIANALTLVSAMLLARVRTLEENGIYSQLMLIINLAVSIFMLGLPNSINYFLSRAETKEDQNYFLSVYYTISTLLSLVLGLTLVCLIPGWESYFKNPTLGEYAFFLLLFPWAKIITGSMENVLVVLKKTGVMMAYRILNCVLLLTIIVLIWMTDAGFKMYIILYVVVEGAFAVVVFLLVSHYTGRLRVRIDRELLKKVFGFSIPIGLASVVGTLNIELDKLMVGRMMSTEELAIYTNASKEMPVTLIATSLTAVLMPRMVKAFDRGENETAIALWRDATSISFAIIAFLGIGMATFASEAMTVLYSEKYAAGASVFAIYSLGLLLRCTYFGMILNATGYTQMILYCAIGSLALNLVLNYGLFQLIGMTGPAWATLLSSLAMQLLQLGISSQKVKIKFRRIFPWKSMMFCTVINCVFAAVFNLIHKVFWPGVWSAVILAGVWGALYLVIVFKRVTCWWERLNRYS